VVLSRDGAFEYINDAWLTSGGANETLARSRPETDHLEVCADAGDGASGAVIRGGLTELLDAGRDHFYTTYPVIP
jgi:hypothetical protein